MQRFREQVHGGETRETREEDESVDEKGRAYGVRRRTRVAPLWKRLLGLDVRSLAVLRVTLAMTCAYDLLHRSNDYRVRHYIHTHTHTHTHPHTHPPTHTHTRTHTREGRREAFFAFWMNVGHHPPHSAAHTHFTPLGPQDIVWLDPSA